MTYYFVEYTKRKSQNTFKGYYSKKVMHELVNDPEIFIESLCGDFDLEYVQDRAKKYGLNIVS